MSNRLTTFDQAMAFTADVDSVGRQVDQVLAHWHDVGQSHWTGGSLKDPGEQNDAPAARVAAAFKALREAREALSRAGHELTMHATSLAGMS